MSQLPDSTIPKIETARTATQQNAPEKPGEHIRLLSGGNSNVEEKWQPKSMYLQTLENRKAYGKRHLQGRPTNNTADIEGAQPRERRGRGYTSPPMSFSLQTHDIPGAQPRKLGIRSPKGVARGKGDTSTTRKERNPIDCSDIDGASPNPKVFRTQRCVNPLDPDYKLASDPQSKKAPPVEHQKFIRDTMDLSDIEGSKPKKKVEYGMRDSMNVHDIEGASANWKAPHKRRDYQKRPEFNQLNVSDISGKPSFVSSRQSNPLSPSYRINGMDISDDPFLPREVKVAPGKSLERTKQQLKVGRQEPFFALHTDDIIGAQANTAGGNINNIGLVYVDDQTVERRKRRDFREVNSTKGIEGAQCNTLKRGLRSKRQTDPLNPQYLFLNGSPRPDSPLIEPKPDRPLRPSRPTERKRSTQSARRPSIRQTKTARGDESSTSRQGQKRMDKLRAEKTKDIEAVKSLPDTVL